MLRRDSELRLSAATQARYRACGDDPARKEAVTRAVQRRVASEAGFADCVSDGVELLQSCLSLFPGDEEVVGAAFYLKNNIHVPCPIRPGSLVPDLELHELHGPGARTGTGTGPGAGARIGTGTGTGIGTRTGAGTIPELCERRPCALRELISRAPLTVLCAGSAT